MSIDFWEPEQESRPHLVVVEPLPEDDGKGKGRGRKARAPKPPKVPKPKKGSGVIVDGLELKAAPKFVLYKGRKSKPMTIARAIRALCTVLRVGESEAKALEIVGKQFRKYEIGRAFEHAATVMREQGATFKQALMGEEIIPRTVKELLSASKTSQAIHYNLEQAAKLIGEAQNVKKRLLNELIQPGFMLALCLGLLYVATSMIIPSFISTFEDLGAETPKMSLILLSVADVTSYVLGALIVVLVLFFAYWATFGRKSDNFKRIIDTMALRSPYVGPIMQLSASSRLFQLLSANLNTGLSESEALLNASRGCGNEAIKAYCAKHVAKMEDGLSTLKEFADTPLIPFDGRSLLLSAPSVAQEIEIMNELAPEYRKEAELQLEQLTKIMGPTVNYLVYGVASLLIAAVVLPMYAIYPALMNMGG